MRPSIFTTQLNNLRRLRDHDEMMLIRHLQAEGLNKDDARRAASEYLSDSYHINRKLGGIVSIERLPGDNGGPLLDE